MTTMSEAAVERARAGQLADDDIVGILRHQHALIPDLFSEVHGSTGAHRRRAFNELRALLAVHEAAEEMVLRPVTAEIARSVADARNREEKEAARLLRELERTDIHSEEFRRRLTAFQKAVIRHAEHEENDEFPILRAARGKEERRQLGRRR